MKNMTLNGYQVCNWSYILRRPLTMKCGDMYSWAI